MPGLPFCHSIRALTGLELSNTHQQHIALSPLPRATFPPPQRHLSARVRYELECETSSTGVPHIAIV